MVLNVAYRLQVLVTFILLLALLQAADRAPVEGATASRRALTGLSHSHSTAVHHPVSQQTRSRTLLDGTGRAAIAGDDSADGSQSGGSSSNPSTSAGIVAGVFLGLTLLGTVAGCAVVRSCGGEAVVIVATAAPASDAEQDQKAAKAQEIPVLTGLRISQPDGTFACAIDSAPCADLELGGCCTAACGGADDSPQGCKGCGCSAASKV